jgi:hypothetical protein
VTGEVEVKLWVLGGLVVALVSISGFLLIREFTRKDREDEKLAGALRELNNAVSALTLAVEEIRAWSMDRFVGWDDHRADLATLRNDIQMWAERFDRDLENCARRCPGK